MKKNNGFTLVELLAVIVILAIIMIIAIPTVLNTMERARKKAFIEFAQRAMNEAQKVYLSRSLTENYISIGEETLYMFDIQKDLGLNNVGDYRGIVSVRFLRTGGENQNIPSCRIELINKDYYISYSNYADGEINESMILSSHDFLKFFSLDDDIDYKTLVSSVYLSDPCNFWDISIIDGITNTQILCTKSSTRSLYMQGDNFVCPYSKEQYKQINNLAIQKFFSGENPIVCP